MTKETSGTAVLTEALVPITFPRSAEHASASNAHIEWVAHAPNRLDSVRRAMPPPPAGGSDVDEVPIRAILPRRDRVGVPGALGQPRHHPA